MPKPPKKFQDTHDVIFARLAHEVAESIAKNKDGRSQKERFEELVEAEKLFHSTMLNYRISTEMYRKFISLIRVVNNNILSARPYFRENSETFSKKITPALKENDPEGLKPFNVNFHFIKFMRDSWIGLWPKKLEILYKKVETIRTILIEVNMPLCINRAKIFHRKNRNGHLAFNDMVEVSAMGLCAAIDKYTGPFLKNFAGVIIGRAVGNLIDANCETDIHFYPGDRRILYRANMIKWRQGVYDIADLAKAINDSFQVDLSEGKTAPKPTNVSDLAYLLAASSIISVDSNEGEDGYGVYSFTPSHDENAEEILGKKQEISNVARLARKLPLINQKVLRLKGIGI